METIRSLIAIGIATKRAVVMPKIFCGLDRWWGAHDGIIPGAGGPQLPFICPLDHVMDLEYLDRPNIIEWKESSFLDNPKAESIKSRVLSVITCNEHSTQCDDGSKPATLIDSNIIKLRAKRTDAQLSQALEGISEEFDLIEFDNPSKLWKAFQDHGENDRFTRDYLMSTSMWCCVQPPEGMYVGHVWYDFLGGSKDAHTDRWGRWVDMNDGEWIPQIGP